MQVKEKPDLREMIGIAVNAKSLRLEVNRETPLLRIGAMGSAAMAVASGADVARLPVAAMAPEVMRRSMDMRDLMLQPPSPQADPRDRIVAELAPHLWHIRYGGQHGLIPRSVRLFAEWIRYRQTFAEVAGPEHEALRIAFAARVMHEWLSGRCVACGGSGKEERSRTGQYVRPRGSMQRNAVFRVCEACKGTRRAMFSNTERRRALDMTLERYDNERWGRRFLLGICWLRDLLPQRMVHALTVTLERRKRRP